MIRCLGTFHGTEFQRCPDGDSQPLAGSQSRLKRQALDLLLSVAGNGKIDQSLPLSSRYLAHARFRAGAI